MKSKKFRPYVRRANGREKTGSWRVALELGAQRLSRRPFFVLVQHGFKNHVLAVGDTKRDLQRSPLPVAVGRKTFREWARETQRFALGEKRGAQ